MGSGHLLAGTSGPNRLQDRLFGYEDEEAALAVLQVKAVLRMFVGKGTEGLGSVLLRP